MQRFFIENIDAETASIAGGEAHYLKNVLRKKKGDVVFLFDGKGVEYEAKIEKLDDKEVKLKILSKVKKEIEPKIKINLFQSIPKAKKFDFIVEKTTELGVSRIIPVISERTQFGIQSEEKKILKLARWRKIALAASKQCGRTIIPEILGVTTFQNAVSTLKTEPKTISIIPWECENDTSLKAILKTAQCFATDASTVNLFIGPEGGFSNSEIELAKRYGVVSVSLGKRILRTETAPIVVISNILYEIED